MSTTICAKCGTFDSAKRVTPGSFVAELALWIVALPLGFLFSWFVLLLPGAYSVFRALSPTRRVCRSCGGEELVPVDTPIGQKLLRDFPPPQY